MTLMDETRIEAVKAATEALQERALVDGSAGISWTDRTGDIVISLEGDTQLIAYTAVSAAWEIFNTKLIQMLVDSYLENRTKGIEEGRRIAAEAVLEALSHPAFNGTQHWDSDVDSVPGWIRITAVNAAKGTA